MEFSSIYYNHAYLTVHNNLVFDTSLATRYIEYKLYFRAQYQTLGNHMAIYQIDRETRWAKFIFDSIPLDTSMDDIIISL